jgi:ABC-2 type transport system ATP-binding protein
LSGGQKQRFSIVASMVNDPEIVFLDEPTTGLDPLARRNLWKLITEIKNQGKTIVITTHYLEEAEILCDRIAIMESGNILLIGKTHELIEKAKNPFKIVFHKENLSEEVKVKIRKLGELIPILGKYNYFELFLQTQVNLNKATKIIQEISPESFVASRATLEDLFIELTGKTIGE